MTKEQTEACEKLAEKFSIDFHEYFNAYYSIAFQVGYKAACQPDQRLKDPLVKSLVEALKKVASYEELDVNPYSISRETLKQLEEL